MAEPAPVSQQLALVARARPRFSDEMPDAPGIRLTPSPDNPMPTCDCKDKEKSMKAQERQIDRREAAVKAKEQQLSDQSMQMAAVKAHNA